MAGRAYELDAEALRVIIGCENIDGLDIAAIAGAGIGMEDP
jgi:hypothetical protein